MKRETIEGQTIIGFGGIDWRCWYEFTIDGDEIVEEITSCEIAPKIEGINDAWIGDRISIHFDELDEQSQEAIEAASYRTLSEYLRSCAEEKFYGVE